MAVDRGAEFGQRRNEPLTRREVSTIVWCLICGLMESEVKQSRHSVNLQRLLGIAAWISNVMGMSPERTGIVCHGVKSLQHIRYPNFTWWRHQMETFSALQAICAGNSPVPGELPAQRPLTRIFDVFFDLRRNKRLRKQSWGWWFETLSCPLWRHCNEMNCSDLN